MTSLVAGRSSCLLHDSAWTDHPSSNFQFSVIFLCRVCLWLDHFEENCHGWTSGLLVSVLKKGHNDHCSKKTHRAVHLSVHVKWGKGKEMSWMGKQSIQATILGKFFGPIRRFIFQLFSYHIFWILLQPSSPTPVHWEMSWKRCAVLKAGSLCPTFIRGRGKRRHLKFEKHKIK